MDNKRDINYTTTPRLGAYIVLLSSIIIILYLFINVNMMVGVMFSALPIILFLGIVLLRNPYLPFFTFFVSSYFIMGIARYIPIPSIGLSADGLLIFSLVACIVLDWSKKVEWRTCINEYSIASLIWMIYCFLQLLNPYAAFQAWATSIRFVAVYGVFVAILVPLIFHKYRDLRRVIFFWSIFTLLAVIKVIIQKEVGFDFAENRWLFVEGKASTHILGSGVRYFSFFTDAANFGSGMGMSMVTFIIIGIHSKNTKRKIYYTTIGFLAGYAMMLSGTRSAMIIPFAGFFFYIIFSGKWKIIVFGSTIVVLALMFFMMTNIGQGNAQIRRMRSAFNSKQDASYNLRKMNQQKIAAYMINKPFGVGIGMGGGKAAGNSPGSFTTQIATDSWAVVLWVETGVVGVALYLIIFLYLQLRGAYIVFFKIKDEQLKFTLGGLLAGIFGIMVSSYSNEVIAQFPNGILIFMGQAFIFMGRKYDKEITEKNMLLLKEKNDEP